jgi:hypothetical protein
MDKEFDKVEFLVKGDEGQMAAMIEYINRCSAVGHSFNIVVDPDLSEYKKSFFADGDGSFRIKDVKNNGVKVELDKEGDILESYLRSL